MQPDLRYDVPRTDAQTRGETQDMASVAAKERERDGLPPPRQDLFQQRWRRRPSPTMWHLILLLGDGSVLLVLLALLLPPPAHLVGGQGEPMGLSGSGHGFGLWAAHFAWLALALASWSCAVNIMQAQKLSCAASLLKSPLSILGSLALMLIFCTVFLYLSIGSEVLAYMRALLVFLLVAAPTLVVWRVLLAEAINLPRFRRQAVIVGLNAAGRSVARELLGAKHPSANAVGFISEEIKPQEEQDGLPILGSRSALHSLARSGMIDMIIMAIDYKEHPELFQEALAGAQRGITVLPVTAVYESTSGKIPVEHLGDQWYTVMPTGSSASLLYICWVKALDFTFGLCGLIVLALLLPFLALLIYLDSPGPIFYTQERSGYHGRTFSIYKFRSMHTEKEQAKRPAWVTKDDPRITRVGRVLRATHLDEVPQTLNILRGEMSLIGPRPERPAFVAELEKSSIFYRYRLSVKPGLTGWAQVKYGYGVADHDELVKLQYDLYYIKHRSWLFDVLILLKTCIEVGCAHGS